MLAIDFTGSNGPPNDARSLHYMGNPQLLNPYQQCIVSLGEIVLNYDSDRYVPVFGFGGKPHFQQMNSNAVQHCFPLTGNLQNPFVKEIAGIMQVYA
jgi:hypothetical protein